MKTLTGIFGACLIFISIALFVAAFALSNTPSAPLGFIIALAVVALVVGVLLDQFAERKICPSCAEKVKNAANVCRYCGHKFSSTSPS